MKRTGRDAGIEMQIDKNRYDASNIGDSSNNSGGFDRASEEELQKRKIIRVKRSIPTPSTTTGSKTNPFSFGNNSAKVTSNPFSNISFGLKKPSKVSFTLGNNKKEEKSTSIFSKKTNTKVISTASKKAGLNKAFISYISKLNTDGTEQSKWEIALVNYITEMEELLESKQERSSSEGVKVGKTVVNKLKDGEESVVATKDDEDVGIKVNDDEDLVYNTRAKVMELKEDNTWATKSIGTLMLVKTNDSDSAFVRMQNEKTGRTTVNLSVPKGFKVQIKSEKKSVLFSGLSYIENSNGSLDTENEGKLMNFLTRFKTTEQANKFGNSLQKLL